ncbi:MAG: tyrosine-type recombinase/integrase, partial [Bacillota bacterium]|nr:tyrosine-type recombinase/integrase [Bacillota bacterium]
AKKAGLQGASFHCLRHTADSLLLAAGVPPVVAMKLMGHKRPSMTVDLYGHVLPEEAKRAAERLDQALGDLRI